jgi:RNA polymerase sigma-70 factor (ECF subfamily)
MSINEHDAEKLARLWTESQPVVASYIFALLPNFHQAEDVVQEVAVILVKRFSEYDQTLPFLPWAMGIAKNKVLNARRNVATDRHLLFDETSADHLLATICQDESADWRGALRHALQQCLNKQRGRILDVLRLRYASDLKPAEIAEQMGLTSGAVRALLHRGRTALRTCIRHRMREAAR